MFTSTWKGPPVATQTVTVGPESKDNKELHNQSYLYRVVLAPKKRLSATKEKYCLVWISSN